MKAQFIATQEHSHLHALYRTILEGTFSNLEDVYAYKVVFGTILLAIEPVSSQTLLKLLSTHVSANVVTKILHSLQNLLFFNNQGKIQVIHPSLADFLLHPQAARFYIDPKEMQPFLFQQCISILVKQLRFNICHIETSYKTNTEISDLQTRIAKKISSELQYSCLYWIQHLLCCETSILAYSVPLLNSLFVNMKTLFWIECLSLLSKLDFGFNCIKRLQQWLKVCNFYYKDSTYTHLVYEVHHFISRFYGPIVTSTPHLYISAVPFSPSSSLVYKMCHIYLPNRVMLRSQLETYWRADSFLFSGSSNGTHSISFVPLTNLICSASSHDQIQLWDPFTGQKVENKIIGHKKKITALALLYDKKFLITGSQDSTICFWDFDTFRSMYQPFDQHPERITSLLVTKDYKSLFSACYKKVICWDLSKDFPIIVYAQQPAHGARSLCLTTDNQYLICGTLKHTIIIWNALTGAVIKEFGNMKYEAISSIACSPTDHYIVCGYSRGQILAWDLRDYHQIQIKKIGGYSIVGVIITICGKYLIVASTVLGIYIYNAHTMEKVCDPLVSQKKLIIKIALSEDEHYLAASLENASVLVWDFKALVQEAQLGFRNISGFAYSESGSTLATFSYSTVTLWDDQLKKQTSSFDTTSKEKVTSLLLSHDGKVLIIAVNNKQIEVWDLFQKKMQFAQTYQEHFTPIVTSLAYIPSMQYLIAGKSSGSIAIWNMVDGQTLFKEFHGHTRPVKQIALYSKDTQLLSWANDGTLRMWDANCPKAFRSWPDSHYTNVLLSGEKIESVNFYEIKRPETCGFIDTDGWLVYGDRYYLWIPPYYRLSLQNPQLVCLPPTGINSSVQLDWSLFVHGNKWTDIYVYSDIA
ncbi:WD40 repeat-like protein [Pluteus cervinus]|uniref:WD40 repeat-like protein n=1 Tax=Pluteus cervinus TaxID=181527 RepID=A0ACD3AD67_9AGAR|nr:WD40 repeat-like protein [Pluteus cervinus]